jgi:hypothetical protein
VRAGELLGLLARQARRLFKQFERIGPSALVSRKRGRPSNHRLPSGIKEKAVALVRERYLDFGPTLAHEKLAELHDVRVSNETLRKWMAEAGIWKNRAARKAAPHQPRNRRECLGELVQIDGCDHHWFEERGPACSLLVYVDDATGKLMELRFVVTESALDYFEATCSYLGHHGKPVAFYSDKHSIFRAHANPKTAEGRSVGTTQFARALADLNIDIICANTPQAKGRVERMNSTLQDRLVKELRLQKISSKEAANAFAPAYMADYNRRFGRAPLNSHDAHRPLLASEDLQRIFTWQEQRTLTSNLVVHFKRKSYLVRPSPETIALGGRRVLVLEHENGEVELRHGDTALPYVIFDKNPHVTQGTIVENKHLGAVLALAQATQATRDAKMLGSKALTLREKARLPAPVNDPSLEPATPFVVEALSLAISVSEARARAANRKNQQAFLARKRAELAALAAGEPASDATNRQLRKVVAVGYVDKGTEQNRSTVLLGPPTDAASST